MQLEDGRLCWGIFLGTISDDGIDTSSLSRHLQGPRRAAPHRQCTVVLRHVERAFTCFLLVLDLCSKNWCRKRMLLCSGLCTRVLSVYDGPLFEATRCHAHAKGSGELVEDCFYVLPVSAVPFM